MVCKQIGRYMFCRVMWPSCLGLLVWLAPSESWAQNHEPPVAASVESAGSTKAAMDLQDPSDKLGRVPSDYVVSPEDTLDVYIMDVPEVSRPYRVAVNGSLSMPLLPAPIPAAGLTLNQLGDRIAQKFHEAGMLNDAHVLVTVHETRLHSVIVSGSVKKPAAYPVYGPTRLMDLLTQAGGLADEAGTEVVVKRGLVGARAQKAENGAAAAEDSVSKDAQDGSDPKDNSFKLDIQGLLKSGDESTNVLLYPGDRMIVQRATLIYLLGAVNRPGGYALHDPEQQMTVMKVLALAGDVSSIARKKRLVLLRKDPAAPDGKREEIAVDFKSMVDGKIADMRLQPDDILIVPTSAKSRVTQSLVNTSIQSGAYIATGLAVYRF